MSTPVRQNPRTSAPTATQSPLTAEERRRFAAWGGSHTSERKRAAALANLAKSSRPGRPLKDLSEIACCCGRGPDVPAHEHLARCTITKALRRREKRGIEIPQEAPQA